MHTVAFYSHRGGVGRTTALVNVAVELAHRGRKVLVVDFDLQAPDLTNFGPLGRDEPHRGLVEYVSDYLDKGCSLAVQDYLYPAGRVGEKGGEIWVMPAGRRSAKISDAWAEYDWEEEIDWQELVAGHGDAEYRRLLDEIDWQELYDLHKGYLFFQDTKRQWEDQLKPDYVLIDTHAGITDTLGIATRQLADAVVFIFVPDTYDVAGLHQVYGEITAEADDSGPHKIQLYFAVSKIPTEEDEDRTLAGRISRFQAWETSDEMRMLDLVASIPYSARLLSEKEALVRTHPRTRLAREYRRLVNALVVGNATQDRDGARVFLAELSRDPGRAVEGVAEHPWDRWSSARRLDEILKNFSHDGEIVSRAATCLFLARREQKALETLDTALEDERLQDDSRLWWQRALFHQKLENTRQAADDLLRLLDTRTAAAQVLEQLRDMFAYQTEETKALIAELSNKTVEEVTVPSHLTIISDYLYLSELNLQMGDTSDKLDDDLPGIDPYIVSAMRRLREWSPKQFEEAKQKPCIQRLPPEDQDRLFAERPTITVDSDPVFLISTRQWDRAIALLEPQVKSSATADPESAFHLAMAYWGAGDEKKAIDSSKLAVGRLLESLTSAEETRRSPWPTDFQMLSLLFAQQKECEKAKAVIGFIRDHPQVLHPPEGISLFSCWRYKKVSLKQFAEDCYAQWLMIKGAKFRPPFLAPAG
jgi:cellulose biosynthesis protein BcsQ